MTLSASTAIADLIGCRSRAAPAMKKRKTSAAAAAGAFMLTGNADNADPVCSKSPHHHKILEARREAACSDMKIGQLQFRNRTRSQLIYKTREL